MSKLKKWLVRGGVAGAIVVLLLLFAPTLLSVLGIARGLVRNAVAERVHGTVEIDAVRIGWRGPQVIEGLRITDADGAPVADVDVRVTGGLRDLLGEEPIEAFVSGSAETRLRDDRTLSWQDLLVAGDPATPAEVGVRQRAVVVGIEGLALRLHDDVAGRTVDLDWLGSGGLRPGGLSDVHLAGTGADGARVSIDVEAFHLVDAFGTLTPNGATLEATLTVEAMPVLGAAVPGTVDRLVLTAESDNLTRRLILGIETDTTMPTASGPATTASHLEGQLAWSTPFDGDGSLRFAPTALTGTLAGNGVPSDLFQVLVASTGIDLARDLGPVFDLNASLPGESGGFAVSVRGEYMSVLLTGTMDAASATATLAESRVRGRLHPILVRDLTGIVSTAEATVVALDIDGGAATFDADFAPTELTVAGALTLETPAALVVTADGTSDPLVEIEPFTTRFEFANEIVELTAADLAFRDASDDEPLAVELALDRLRVPLPGWRLPTEMIVAMFDASVTIARGGTPSWRGRDLTGGVTIDRGEEEQGVSLVVSTGTLATTDPVNGRPLEIDVRDVGGTVFTSGLADGVRVTALGFATVAGAPEGRFNVKATVSNLVDAGGLVVPDDAAFDAEVKTVSLSTAIVDTLAGFDGLMAAAFGPSFDLDADADEFSRNAGRFDAHVRSPQGYIRCVGNGRDRTMHISGDDRATAQILLSPLFRRKLASRVCPIFLDVVSDDPMLVTASEAIVPLDGDLRRLAADLHVEFGAVRFKSESPTMVGINRIVAMLAGGATVGSIDPTDIRIRDGVAHIDGLRFVIGDHPCTMQGSVDMVTNTLDLRMGVPAQIAKVARVRELAILDGVLDLAIRGPASSPTIEPVLGEIDPAKVIKDIFDLFK